MCNCRAVLCPQSYTKFKFNTLKKKKNPKSLAFVRCHANYGVTFFTAFLSALESNSAGEGKKEKKKKVENLLIPNFLLQNSKFL